MFEDSHAEQIVGASRATVISPQSLQCQAGIRWPHQSCREMVQSRIFSSQLKYTFSNAVLPDHL